MDIFIDLFWQITTALIGLVVPVVGLMLVFYLIRSVLFQR